jgi:hypothetical protein
VNRVIRINKSKKNGQHNGQKKKDKRTNNDLQNIHIKLKIEYILCYRKLKTLSMSLILDLLFFSRDDENEEQTIS